MQNPLRPAAANVVQAIAMAKAIGNAAGALVCLMLTFWLLSFHHVFGNVLAFAAGVTSIGLALDACFAYVQAKPELSPTQRQQYLDSRLLYNPERREAERRRNDQSRQL